MPLPLGKTQCFQRIQRLTRLRDHQRRRAFGRRQVAVTVFRGDIYLGRQSGDFLEPVACDKTGIEGRATGGDVQAVQIGKIELETLECRRPGRGMQMGIDGIADHLRLLVDFLEHEVTVIALAGHGTGYG